MTVTDDCFTLQFYQQLAYGDIDEQYLWEQRLQPQLSYLSEEHRTKVREALSLGYDAHNQQKRKSGEPFITHPVEVTRILAELQMDYESLIAGELSLASLRVFTLAVPPALPSCITAAPLPPHPFHCPCTMLVALAPPVSIICSTSHLPCSCSQPSTPYLYGPFPRIPETLKVRSHEAHQPNYMLS